MPRIPETRCPQCTYKMDAALVTKGPEETPPRPGDVSLCFNCGQVLMFKPGLTLRKATAAEISKLMSDPKAWATIEKAQLIIRKRGRIA